MNIFHLTTMLSGSFPKKGIAAPYEKQFFRKDGSRVWVYLSDVMLPGPEKHIIAFVLDITKRKNAEEALRKSEASLKRSQAIAHLGSWEFNLVTNHISWSDEVYRIFGLKPQEFSATYEEYLSRIHPEDRDAVDSAYKESVREGRDFFEIEYRVVRKYTGEIRYVHEKCHHIHDEQGKIVRSVGMVHDITNRKQSELQLKKCAEELAAVTAIWSLSHIRFHMTSGTLLAPSMVLQVFLLKNMRLNLMMRDGNISDELLIVSRKCNYSSTICSPSHV